MPKYARQSFNEPYLCQYDWPEDCAVQCGGKGIVLTKGSLEETLANPVTGLETVLEAFDTPSSETHYQTAFFEAFPNQPDTFLRGEGRTIPAAEEACWKAYQKILRCPQHDFDRGHYRNGYGICKHCGLFFKFAEPLDKCCICQVPTTYCYDTEKKAYCEDHIDAVPENLQTKSYQLLQQMLKEK